MDGFLTQDFSEGMRFRYFHMLSTRSAIPGLGHLSQGQESPLSHLIEYDII
jgi:hypothetical protein